MKDALKRWLILTLAVMLASNLMPGIHYESWTTLFIASLVLGILNTFLKPLILIFSLPFIILSFGLFLIFINCFLLQLTDWIVPDFHVSGFWSTLGGALIISVVNLFFGENKKSKKETKTDKPSPSSQQRHSRRSIKDDDVIDI